MSDGFYEGHCCFLNSGIAYCSAQPPEIEIAVTVAWQIVHLFKQFTNDLF